MSNFSARRAGLPPLPRLGTPPYPSSYPMIPCIPPYPSSDSKSGPGWTSITVNLCPNALEWLNQLLREREATLQSQESTLPAQTGSSGLGRSAVLHVRDCDLGISPHSNLYAITGSRWRTLTGRLDLQGDTVDVSVVVWEGGLLPGDHRVRRGRTDCISMKHPNIIPILGHGWFRFQSREVVVLPARPSTSLRTYLRAHRGADKRGLKIIQVAEALEYLHYQAHLSYAGLVPSSVHINDSGCVILDQPWLVYKSRYYNHGPSENEALPYSAPEIVLTTGGSRWEKPKWTPESDMYAFGMLIYEILSGREPWADAKLVDIFRCIVVGQLLPRPEDAAMDDSMWNLCTACWSQNPADRPSMANVLAGLRSSNPPTRWRPDHTVEGDRWLPFARSSLEGYATPSVLNVDIDGSIVNIVLQKQEAATGGFSTVVKGYSYQDGATKAYAVKICRGKSVMPREYEIWKSLRHENILRLLSIVATNLPGAHELIFVSPYLKNGNLTKYLDSFPRADRLTLMIGVAMGLAYLHNTKEIVHGDIKAENILITADYTAVLADFGFSTYVTPGPEETILELRQVYTLTYCAPEVLDDTAEDPSHPGVIRSKTRMSDMYAFGVLLYQTYAGGLGNSQRARMRLMLDMHDGHFPSRPGGDWPILCDDLWSICKRCWLRDPLQRPIIATVLAELQDLDEDKDRWYIVSVQP